MDRLPDTSESATRFSTSIAGILIGANITGVLLSYLLMLYLAHRLSAHEFDGFVGAIAVLTMFGALAEAGVGKYAYKRIPLADQSDSRRQRKAYFAFAKRMVFVVSALFVAIGIGLESQLVRGAVELTSLTAVLFIPAIAGCGVAVDLLIASRSPILGTLIARALVPTVTLTLILASAHWIKSFDATLAVICFGIGSVVGLLVCLPLLIERSQPDIGPDDSIANESTTGIQWGHWLYRSLSYFAIGCAITWLFKAPLVVLHHLPHSSAELGLLAPAFETGCLVLLLSKSADKYYFPMLAVAIDTGDMESDQLLRRRRQAVIGGAALVFWVILYQFGDWILSLFGPQFVTSHTALIWISSGACLWTLFSLSPTALLFMGQSRQLAANLILHSVAMVGMIPIAFLEAGSNGVACVFAICLGSAAIVAKYQEHRAWRNTKLAV
ncbi:lipopolysaccharide biosynthesis protein [Rhodopirellula sp. MGV]|uniref:lipopolysaccharide biosynthesis protein n=1 Tax=Rhodopirellula sp. MGV TaxID=2023130 RepID=UPI000B969572|nr:hypothetical protein [Rhodopirellula sp. MGV]OYP32985.1 hypothetical protein CGZ80_19000 [Rhodopirellula sp. MGV]PNY35357.1 hypothetical protein C2E31_17710 [Rhodopirellula baltica]